MPEVLGIKIYGYDIPTAVTNVVNDINTAGAKMNRLISATGVHGIVTAQRSPAFKTILADFYCNLPDGMPGVWIGKLKGAKEMKRCPGPDFFECLLKESSKETINHFFCGGKEGVADELKMAVEKKFGNKRVVGTFCPPFRDMTNDEMQNLGQMIIDSGAHIVWIGLGTPKQEKFAHKLREFTKTNYIITVGAAFDFHTDRLKKAPAWIQKSGFEWTFRLLMEPKRLYKRYFSIVPLFIYYNSKEWLNFIKNKIKATVFTDKYRQRLGGDNL